MKQIIRLARKSPGGVSSVEFEPPPVEIESFTAWPMITVYILGQKSHSFSYIYSGTFVSLWLVWGKNQVFCACCSTQTVHKVVKTILTKNTTGTKGGFYSERAGEFAISPNRCTKLFS